MAWIESHTVLRRHRKIIELAKELRIRPVYAMGHLHGLWHVVMEQQEDGDISSWSDEFIAESADFPGDAPQFVRLLQKHGWLGYRDDEGNIVPGTEKKLHDWLDYAGRFLIKRYSSSESGKAWLSKIWAKHGRSYGQSDPKETEKRAKRVSTPPNLTPPNLTKPKTKTHTLGLFEALWARYPSKDGKKLAQRAFLGSVKTTADEEAVRKALENYLASDRVQRGYVKNGSTWFNNWRDWVDFKEPERGGDDGKHGSGFAAPGAKSDGLRFD